MNNNVIIIGISGPSASGKSLLANTIVKELGNEKVAIISEDSYYRDLSHLHPVERAKFNFDHPSAFEHDLLKDHLVELQAGKSIEVPVYDHITHSRLSNTFTVGNQRIVVLEGILLFVDPVLRSMMDIRIFMDSALDICLLRRLKRDIICRGRCPDSVFSQYTQTVRPMYVQFIEPSKRYADISVPHGGANRIAIDMIKAKINMLLATSPETYGDMRMSWGRGNQYRAA